MTEQIFYTLSKADLEQFAYKVATMASEKVLEHFRHQQEGYVTRKEAAKIRRCSLRTIDSLIARGEIKAEKKGARVLILRTELKGYDMHPQFFPRQK